MLLTDFVSTRPRHALPQALMLAWLAEAYAEAEARTQGLDEAARAELAARMVRVLQKVACPPDKIATRGLALADLGRSAWAAQEIYALETHPHGRGSEARTRKFEEIVDAYFTETYAAEADAPGEIVHVTCTGYASPSGAQKMVAARGWGGRTRVTHAYQMGCYAAVPALRLAAGSLALPADLAPARPVVDIVHTELCSLHLDPTDHSLEQMVVHSLFADGLIRYRARPGSTTGPGLRVIALHEEILPDSADAMSWRVGDHGMQMTLSREVPDRIAGALRGFTSRLLARAGLGVADLPATAVAVHPGGPKIIDRVAQVLELAAAQVATSRAVLHDHGNMSSATLPHIWMRMLADPAIAAGTRIPSFAFGPGLTMCGAILEKQA